MVLRLFPVLRRTTAVAVSVGGEEGGEAEEEGEGEL